MKGNKWMIKKRLWDKQEKWEIGHMEERRSYIHHPVYNKSSFLIVNVLIMLKDYVLI